MFFRDKRPAKTKKSVLQLVKNKRISGSVKQRVVVSLGTDFGLPEPLRRPIATAVTQRLTGQEVLFEDSSVSEWADRIVRKIHTARIWRRRSPNLAGERQDQAVPTVAEVVIDEVAHGHARSLGPLLIGHDFWERLGFPAILFDCGFNKVQTQTAAISILNRLINPGSENSLLTWIPTVAVADLISPHQERRAEEAYLLCRSQGRRQKETAMRNRFEEKLEADLSGLQRLIESGKRKDPTVIEQSIGRIRERHSRVAHYYDIAFSPFAFDFELTTDKTVSKRLTRSLRILKDKVVDHKTSHLQVTKKLAELAEKYESEWTAVTVTVSAPCLSWQPFDEKRSALAILDGCYMLRTDRLDLDDEQTWRLYMTLTRLEAAFRHLKSDLGLRPNFHQREDRVDGHVFISILAYHLLHAIETTLRRNDDHHSWATVRRVMCNHNYSTIMLPTPDGTVIHVRQPGQTEPIHETIYNVLGVDCTKLPVIKTMFKK